MMPVDCSQARTLDLSIECNVMCDTFPTKPNEKAHFLSDQSWPRFNSARISACEVMRA